MLKVINIERLKAFSLSYISYFDPKVLFFEGDRNIIHSTNVVGAVLFPISFLLVFGIIEIIRRKDNFAKLILFGFLSFPLAPSLIADPQRISRALVVSVFIAIIVSFGIALK